MHGSSGRHRRYLEANESVTKMLLVLAALKEVLAAAHVECAPAIEVEHVQSVDREKGILYDWQDVTEDDTSL